MTIIKEGRPEKEVKESFLLNVKTVIVNGKQKEKRLNLLLHVCPMMFI